MNVRDTLSHGDTHMPNMVSQCQSRKKLWTDRLIPIYPPDPCLQGVRLCVGEEADLQNELV